MAHILDEPINSPTEEIKPFPSVPNIELINPLASKHAFVSPSDKQYEQLLTHLKRLLSDGQGETVLHLGVGEGDCPGLSDSDLEASKATVQALTAQLNAVCIPLLEESVENGKLKTVKFLVRKKVDETDFMELRVAVVGNVDAGKSTLLGVLTHGILDNGRGLARQKLFRHKHEMESGRTSSVSNDILGFDVLGQVVNKPVHGVLDWTKICSAAAKVITFIDLAGHERYLKTTVFGMTGHSPHFAMLMVGANAGCVGMTKEHLGLALALGKPVFVVITKVDMCPQPVFEETMRLLTRILRSPGCRKLPIVVNSIADVVNIAINFVSERICPIFCVSNVDGHNLPLLRLFLSLLTPPRPGARCQLSSGSGGGGLANALDPAPGGAGPSNQAELEARPAEFHIDDIFSVPGVGTVVSGLCVQGVIQVNDTLLLGPDALGQFHSLVIKSVHRKRMPVNEVRAQQTASFALKRAVKRNQLRKGMVLVSPALQPKACWEFLADLLVLHHPTTISVRYQAMVHVGPIRQTATIIAMDREHLRTGDRAEVRFRFIKQPEYLRAETGQRMVFREGKTKAVGSVKAVFPHVSAVAQNARQRSTNVKKDPSQPSPAPTAPSVASVSTSSSANNAPKVSNGEAQPSPRGPTRSENMSGTNSISECT